MVRVFVELPKGLKEIPNAQCDLEWNGEVHSLVANLRSAGTRTLVVPSGTYEAAVTNAINKVNDELWAYNFTFDHGKLCPVPTLTLKATLKIKGKTVSTRTETSQTDFKIRHFWWNTKKFVVVVTGFQAGRLPDFARDDPKSDPETGALPLDRNPRKKHYKEIEQGLTKFAIQYAREFLAVYPIPEDKLDVSIYPYVRGSEKKEVDAGAIHYPLFQQSETEFYEKAFPQADSILLVTSKGFTVKTLSFLRAVGQVDGWTPLFNDRVHYIDETCEPKQLVAAHETGHDGRFFGGGHHPPISIPDGWDAGDVMKEVTTAYQRHSLMKEGGGDTDLPWIDTNEYGKLLDVMVAGGKDPELLRLRGVVNRDNTLFVMEPSAVMGVMPQKSHGSARLEFYDAQDKQIDLWPFSLLPSPYPDPNIKGYFNLSAPIPPGSRTVKLIVPGVPTKEWPLAAQAPEIKFLRLTPLDEEGRARVRISADGQPAPSEQTSLAYSPDGQTFYDLPPEPEVNHLAPGEFVVSFKRVPASPNGILKATVSSGLRVAEGLSSPFSVPNHSPSLFIEPVGEAATSTRYQAGSLDPEDGLGLPIQWEDSVGKHLADGEILDLNLVPGVPLKDIYATCTDKAGLKARLGLVSSKEENPLSLLWLVTIAGVLLALGIGLKLFFCKLATPIQIPKEIS
jgi:hypothetical protein